MSIVLDHTIVPARAPQAAARWFAHLFGLEYIGPQGHFAPVRVNASLTLDFDRAEVFEAHHYAFRVGAAEFDAILARLREADVPYGSHPWDAENGRLNAWGGGRGVYLRDPNGHLFELIQRG